MLPTMPIRTVETRWFGDGPLPTELKDWFDDLGSLAPSDWETREDLYLVVPSSSEIGMKVRGGSDSLEVKCRLEAFGRHRFSRSATGLVESWVKWSHPAGEEWTTRLASRYPGMQRVWKSRRKRYYQFDAGTTKTGPTEARGAPRIERGGILEIARLRRGGAEHWSVAMEAFPTDATLAEDLADVLHVLLEDVPDQLAEATSTAYPEWLTKTAKKE
jgi:hypothetical protein